MKTFNRRVARSPTQNSAEENQRMFTTEDTEGTEGKPESVNVLGVSEYIH